MLTVILSITNILLILVIIAMIIWWWKFSGYTKKTSEGNLSIIEKTDPYAKIKGEYTIIKGQGAFLTPESPIVIIIDIAPDDKFMTMTMKNTQTNKASVMGKMLLANDINSKKVIFHGVGPDNKIDNENSVYYEDGKIHFVDGLIIQKKTT